VDTLIYPDPVENVLDIPLEFSWAKGQSYNVDFEIKNSYSETDFSLHHFRKVSSLGRIMKK
jgi:hypothetical protein